MIRWCNKVLNAIENWFYTIGIGWWVLVCSLVFYTLITLSVGYIICFLFVPPAWCLLAVYWYRVRRDRRSGFECSGCGYPTAHASSDRFPECGTPWLNGV